MTLLLSDIGIKPIPLSHNNPFFSPLQSVRAQEEEPITIEHIDYRKQQFTKAKIPGKASTGVLVGIGLGLIAALIVVVKVA